MGSSAERVAPRESQPQVAVQELGVRNLKVVPEIINGRTMLPLRFVSENLGCVVEWAAATQTITITYEP